MDTFHTVPGRAMCQRFNELLIQNNNCCLVHLIQQQLGGISVKVTIGKVL